MIVLVANHLPPAVRGRLKLWCIEPKPNVFVSGVKNALADKLVAYLMKQKIGYGSILFFTAQKAPWYRVHIFGAPSKQMVKMSGLQAVITAGNREYDDLVNRHNT